MIHDLSSQEGRNKYVDAMSKQNAKPLSDGQEVTINVPFTYTIGDEGFKTGKILETIEDCKAEAEAELLDGLSGEIMMEVSVDAYSVNKKDEIERILIDMWAKMGMDTPENFEDIVQECYEDVCETADPVNWSDGDVAIAFRRWIEKKS